jgi:hypothetical protein
VHAQHLLTRDGEHPEWIMRAQIVLGCEWKFPEIIQRLKIIWVHARRVESFSVVRDARVGVTDCRFEPREL